LKRDRICGRLHLDLAEADLAREVELVAERPSASPDINFLLYHSGWVSDGEPEGVYDPKRTDVSMPS
jgi:hypothetical protein